MDAEQGKHQTEEEVLQGMLSHRFNYAKAHRSSTYHHTFR